MKKIFLLLLVSFSLINLTTNAQNPVPNPGFEQWNGNTAVGWYLNNPGTGNDCLTKTTDAYSGQFALRGAVIGIAGFPYPPACWAGSISNQVFPINIQPSTFTGYYKFSPAGNDTLMFTVVVFYHGPDTVITRNVTFADSRTTYTRFDFNYPNIANTAYQASFHAVIRTAGALPTIGTNFHLDNLTFNNLPIGINTISQEVPESYALKQNYPNPFNPTTNIEFSNPEKEFVKLSIFNMLGKEVETLVNDVISAGTYRFDWNAANQPGGTYFYRLTSGNYHSVRKMILIK